MHAVVSESREKKPCSQRLWEAILNLWQPNSRRCDPKTWGMMLDGKMCRQAPRERLWRTAMDLHMGKGRAGACGTQMRQSKEMFWADYLHMENAWIRGVGELRIHMCMHERERGREQPACLAQKQQRQALKWCLQSKPNCEGSFRQHRVRVEDDRAMSSSQLVLQTSLLAAKAWK